MRDLSRDRCATLRGALIVNEEESEEHEIGDWKGDPGYHVDRLRHSNRMRRLFFSQLQKESVLLPRYQTFRLQGTNTIVSYLSIVQNVLL